MPTSTLKTKQECEDFVRGATFFGVGGGGPPARGNQLLAEQLDAGRAISWVDISEIADDAWTVCPFGMGGRPPKGHPTPEELKEAGYFLQVNLLSLTGYYGKIPQEIANMLVKNKLVDLLGTDLHHERHLHALQSATQLTDTIKLLQDSGTLLNPTL